MTFFIAVSYNDGIKKFNQSNNSDIVKLPFQGMSTIFSPLTGLSMPSSKCTHTLFFFLKGKLDSGPVLLKTVVLEGVWRLDKR